MEHYIGFENQFNKIGSDYQSVKQKQKVTKILYLVCNQFFFNTHTNGTAERKKSENPNFSLGSATEQKPCSFDMLANFSKSQFSCP